MSTETGLSQKVILSKIYMLRGKRVMLDSDLADLYEVETRRLNEQVKRNYYRFPEDFMFRLSKVEWQNLKSQNATSSWGGRRKPPYVFTEHGILMLSSVLNSKKAITTNIYIMRAYIKMRELLFTHKDLLLKMEILEKRVADQDQKMQEIFDYLKQFIQEEQKPRKGIGFKPNQD